MYISKLSIKNFRTFGANTSRLQFQPGVNLLVGPNNAGKSAVIDALRFTLGTKSDDWLKPSISDFHFDGKSHAYDFRVEVEFDDLTLDECSTFIEWLGIREDTGKNFLKICLSATRKDAQAIGKYEKEISWQRKAGPDDVGSNIDSDALRIIRATYLKPLRDAQRELSARKSSRLSQIFMSHKDILSAEEDLLKIINSTNDSVKAKIEKPINQLNQEVLGKLLLTTDKLAADISILPPHLKSILEDLHLRLTLPTSTTPTGEKIAGSTLLNQGLGYENILFMAAELLLLSRSKFETSIPLLLIEEPEAHLHPQLQYNLIQLLEELGLPQKKDEEKMQVQTIMTSHSPNISSATKIEKIQLFDRTGRAFSLSANETKLELEDYDFLEKFLDVTKANLFFANSILLIEGDGENILLPVLAKKMGRDLSKFGVSIVNVGHIGFFRYARIFQQKKDPQMNIKVACVADRDIPPIEANHYLTLPKSNKNRKTNIDYTKEEIEKKEQSIKNRATGGPVSVYISPSWTFEHDLCLNGLDKEIHLIVCRLLRNTLSGWLGDSKSISKQEIDHKASEEYQSWASISDRERAAKIYEPLYSKSISKTEFAQHFARYLLTENNDTPDSFKEKVPSYLIKAIDHVTG